MRLVLGAHLQELRALGVSAEHTAEVERELARYGGDPAKPEA